MTKSERRKAILDVAEKLFRHYGPAKMTVADIARAASIGVGTVYLEFRSKDSILGALSARQSERVLAKVAETWQQTEGSAEARLEATLRARYEAFLGCAKEGRHGAELFHCGDCAAIEEAHRSFRERERDLFAGILRELEVAAEDPPAEAQAETQVEPLAEALLLALSACAPPLLQLDPPSPEAARELHRLLIRGLLARARSASPEP